MSPSSRTLKQNLTTKFLIHVKVDQRHLQLPPGHRRLTRNSLGSLVKFFPLDRCSFTYWDQIFHEINFFFLQVHDINLKTKILWYLHTYVWKFRKESFDCRNWYMYEFKNTFPLLRVPWNVAILWYDQLKCREKIVNINIFTDIL